MKYSNILHRAIINSNLSLTKICTLLHTRGLRTNKAQLSKLQNGKMAPAGDKINDAIAEILGIDPLELKAAAYREKIPADVLARLRESSPKTDSA